VGTTDLDPTFIDHIEKLEFVGYRFSSPGGCIAVMSMRRKADLHVRETA
jgi:hypothetical protein